MERINNPWIKRETESLLKRIGSLCYFDVVESPLKVGLY
jgi:hypothetical protein